jgi:hypothetical protein
MRTFHLPGLGKGLDAAQIIEDNVRELQKVLVRGAFG